MSIILETRALTVRFGGLVAVDRVDLWVTKGAFHSVIGPNGAGKTTLFNLIFGLYRPSAGEVLFKGEPITGLKPYEITHKGMGRSFQITNLFPNLTVLENVRLAVQGHRARGYSFLRAFGDGGAWTDEAQAVLEQVGLAERESLPANALAHGEKRQLEIAMLLAAEADLLLLDEPTAGMSHDDVPAVIRVIERIKDTGKTILMVEHKMDLIMALSDRVTVMKSGAVIAEGAPADVAANPVVRAAYLGGLAPEGGMAS
jgi:branched-chain amino acid transport system ATP-binding protein